MGRYVRWRVGARAAHLIRSFDRVVEEPPAGTLHVLALSSQTDFEWLREIRDRLDAPCLLVRDSGVENAVA